MQVWAIITNSVPQTRKKSELPPPEVLSQLKLYDLPEVQADFVEVGAGDEREAVLMLGGITCAACVWLIEQQLLRMKGVVRVDLNYSTHRCRVVGQRPHRIVGHFAENPPNRLYRRAL